MLTGAGGFVGAQLVRELLRRGAEIHAVVRRGSNLRRLEGILERVSRHEADVTDREALGRIFESIRPVYVFHAATRRASDSPEARRATLRTNVDGTLNLLEAAAFAGSVRRLVAFGGSLEYGVKSEPMKETDCAEPSTFYGATKAAATLVAQQFAREHALPLVVLRLFSVYGYWEAGSRLIPTAILAALEDYPLDLTAPGYRRDLIFVADAVEASLRAAQAGRVAPGEIINVGTGRQWSNEEVVELIQEIVGRRIRVRAGAYAARRSDATHWVADRQKAARLLGWEPRHTLPEGLQKTIEWLRLHRDFYEPLGNRRAKI
jgi:nucleoside-diphosphate-sugar epimerase